MQQILPRCRGCMGHNLTRARRPFTPPPDRWMARQDGRVTNGMSERALGLASIWKGESGTIQQTPRSQHRSIGWWSPGLGVCVLCLCFYNQNIRRSISDPRRFSRLSWTPSTWSTSLLFLFCTVVLSLSASTRELSSWARRRVTISIFPF